MATSNEVTGDKLISKSSTQEYRDNFDRIFKKKSKEKKKTIDPPEEEENVQKR